MFDQMIHDIHHWNRISQYFHMNYIKNKISKMSNLGKVNFSPLSEHDKQTDHDRR